MPDRFVALADLQGNTVVVNLKLIAFAYQRDDHADLYFRDTQGISVRQSLAEIFDDGAVETDK